MGLDQYAGIRTHTTKFEWRKHAKLQEFMENIWYKKFGNTEEINCKDVTLTEEIINELEQCIKTNTMPQSPGGFFYGEQFQNQSEEGYKEQDLKFCEWALKQIKDGKQVYYTCWY